MPPILLLSPMQGIADLAPSIAREMGLQIHVAVSDDAGAEHCVSQYADVEIVVSRGGLAQRIAHLPGISVVVIAMSITELLTILTKLTERGFKRIAIVSRANLFSGAVGDFRIFEAQISIHPETDENAIQAKVRQLASEGIEVVIGCLAAYNTAQKLGIEAVFLESDAASIRVALQEAVRILEAKDREKLQAAQLTAIIDNIDEAVIAIDTDNAVSFFNRHAKRLCSTSHPNPLTLPDFSAALAVFDAGEKEQVTNINGHNVIARSIPLEFNQSNRGKVITLHEVSRIHASESKIRTSFYKKGLYARYHFNDMIGNSPLMHTLTERAKTYAGHDANLCIYGETGTGKEVLAQSIHNHSRRNKGSFVSVNIASISPGLLESELFGYVDGAFTGARKGGKLGLFELAHQGTLFLDEIGELAPELQNRFLRVLQEREIMRIGDDKIIPIDVRIISATNQNLFLKTQNGSFRQDLYYRIHVIGLRIPPLRERMDDIPLIFEHCLRRFNAGEAKMLTNTAKEFLKTYAWPGNIRQLRNVAEVLAYSQHPRIDTSDLMEALGEQEHAENTALTGFISIPENGTLKQMESEIMAKLLAKYSADDVCQRLKISRVTLWRKMKNLGVSA